MNYFTSAVTDREWGTLVNIDVEEANQGGVIRYGHTADLDRPFAVVVAAPNGAEMSHSSDSQEVMLQNLGDHVVWVIPQHSGPIEIEIYTQDGHDWASLGFLQRGWRGQARDAFLRFVNKCRACKISVRAALNVATGGGDLTGEALEAAADRIEEILGDTLLDEIFELIRGVVNPGRWLAETVCTDLGYCP